MDNQDELQKLKERERQLLDTLEYIRNRIANIESNGLSRARRTADVVSDYDYPPRVRFGRYNDGS